MKRSRWGGGLLAVLLIVCLAVTWVVERSQKPVCRDLTRACEAALREDWEQAGALVGRAEERWQQYWKLSAAVTDHAPMEAVDGLFAQLRVCLRQRDMTAAALCAELARQVEAVAEAQKPNWWSLL